jgi:recombination protein RecT
VTTTDVATTDAPRAELSPTQQVRGMTSEFALALGGQQLAERFVRVALTAMGRNPDLANCTRETLLGTLMTCAQLRLEPNDPRGLAYLIPFKNTKAHTTEATLIIGYKGLVDLAYRSGQIKTIAAEPVHENDFFREQRWPRQLTHRAADGDRGKVTTYYAAVQYKDGGEDFAVMSVDEIERHRDLYSKGHKRDDSPWRTNFDAMARKTVLRRLSKMMPLSVEDLRQFATAVHVDGMQVPLNASRSLEDLLATDRPAIDAVDVAASPGRVTGAEILGPSAEDGCPGCGEVPAHKPSECPSAGQA